MRTQDQWVKILTGCGVDLTHAQQWAPVLIPHLDDETFDGGDLELTQFLAQCLHETNLLTEQSENLNYRADKVQGVFGSKRISVDQAVKYGRIDQAMIVSEMQGGKPTGRCGINVNGQFFAAKPQAADQQSLANIVYGGPWGVSNLGNTRPGDGWAFRGSGWIEITGAANYKLATKRTDIDFYSNPELMRQVGWPAIYASIEWWKEHVKTNMLTDPVALRHCVNGGELGLQDCIQLANKLTSLMAAEPDHAAT